MTHWIKADHSWTPDSLRHIHTPAKRTKQLLYYIQEIGHFKAVKPYFTERENLSSFLMKFTLSGKGSLIYGGKTYSLLPGDFFFIDCKNYQYYQTESDVPWEMDWIHLDGGNTAEFYKEFTRLGSVVVHSNGNPLKNPIHFIINQLLHMEKENNARTDFKVSILLHELLNELIEQKYELTFLDTEIPAYILSMKELFDTNLDKRISLEDLEHTFHFNRFQLIKEFTKYIGTSPIDYFLNQKISYAKDLLRYSSYSIQEISQSIAIENPAYFSRLFNKRTGVSPNQYRLTIG